jgi:hypothetical protein
MFTLNVTASPRAAVSVEAVIVVVEEVAEAN